MESTNRLGCWIGLPWKYSNQRNPIKHPKAKNPTINGFVEEDSKSPEVHSDRNSSSKTWNHCKELTIFVLICAGCNCSSSQNVIALSDCHCSSLNHLDAMDFQTSKETKFSWRLCLRHQTVLNEPVAGGGNFMTLFRCAANKIGNKHLVHFLEVIPQRSVESV